MAGIGEPNSAMGRSCSNTPAGWGERSETRRRARPETQYSTRVRNVPSIFDSSLRRCAACSAVAATSMTT